MVASYKAAKAKLARLVRTDDLSFIDVDVLFSVAARLYSGHRSYTLVADISGAGSNLLALPATWVKDFSSVEKLVWPYEDHDSDAVAPDQYKIYLDLVSSVPTPKLHMASTPQSGQTVRIWFSALHSFTEAGESTTNTIPNGDLEAVVLLTAALVCQARASYYLGLKDQGVVADLVDYGDKAAQAAAEYDAFMKMYNQLIGISEGKPKPIAAVGDVDTRPTHGFLPAQDRHLNSQR